MCGIAGFVDFNKSGSEEILKSMNRTMNHRGPDGEGYFFKETPQAFVGLAHKRLSIIDLSEAGTQPMHYGPYSITFNGEVYNFAEIRKELELLGHQFHSHSDTEVIIHAYAQWGSKCVNRLIGMFAIVVYDNEKQQLFLLRDRAGIKPLFYYWNNGLFLFGSELKAFHAHPYFKCEIDNNATAAFMQYGYVPAPHCIFKHTQKLLPGHHMTLDFSNQNISTEQYWQVNDSYNKPKLQIDFKSALTKTEELLHSAFEYRMIADVPVGVFLSSGYDSTSVAAILQKNTNRKIKTFTIGVGEPSLNEAPFARKIAEHLGTEHTEYYCTETDALNLVSELPFYYDEPFGDSSAIPTMLVSRMARKEVTVALSADAGDEIFAGYNRYDYIQKLGFLNHMPDALRKAASKLLALFPANASQNPLTGQRIEKLRQLLGNYNTQSILKSLTAQFFDKELQALMVHTTQNLHTNFDLHLRNEYADPLSQMMATDYITYLPDDIMQKVDRATMSTSLEGREPFLDHRVVEWVAQLPNNFKYHNGIKKYLLKEIVHQYVPESMMKRPKMGFAIPVSKWLKDELKPMIDQYICEEKIKAQGIFQWTEVKRYKDSFYNGHEQHMLKIWYLFMFQLWYEKWIK